jgi:hypothetical protein
VEFLKRFGPNITLKIRKKNGETVELDFQTPSLNRNPIAFLGVTQVEDPLAIKN